MKKPIVNSQGLNEAEFLKQYDVSKFERPSVTVDMLLFTVQNTQAENYRKLPEKVLQVLMIKRGDHPFLGDWALPGGFVQMDESLEEAAIRELQSETNVDNVYLEQLYTWGDPQRDPRTRVISCSYMALVNSASLIVKAGDDAADAKWFTVKRSLLEQQKMMGPDGYVLTELFELKLIAGGETLRAKIRVTKTVEGKRSKTVAEIIENDGIAFDHAKIIDSAIKRLRNKVEYTDIAFNLMPEYFTLTELQQVYEIILDTELLKANFRRKIAGMVRETDRKTQEDGHRPAKYFRFNPDWEKHALEGGTI
ncbi:MAG TPA: NUDIX domain-containing protein [Bacillota bacterium]|nr:NUDIX domain-containing protein [Bacillota bacterium]